MLPLKLEIENINSFTDRQTVDFSAVAGDGLFCISGDTGAGKTTILDSMIIALYGMGTGAKTTGGDRGGKDDYINVGADKAYVAFEFAFAGKTYRVERTFTRAGVHKAYLYCDGALVCQTATAVETAVKALLGLEKEQFTQVIVLEQGKFSKFLNAGPQARVRTVMKLFGLERFDMFSKVNKYFAELGHKLDVLNANYDMLTSFDLYVKELETGLLHAGPRHTDDFWKENVRAFELEDFKLIKKLIECLGSKDVDTVCIACHDLSAFACYYPNGRK